MSLIAFEPLYKERIWGGTSLQQTFNRPLPQTDTPIGESWELVDRPDDQSVVVGGLYDGMSLRELCTEHGQELLGPNYDPNRPFPILLKWLDCSARLSLQVHPPKDIAPSLGGQPKTECWYIAQATPEAAVFAGLKAGVSKEAFKAALKTNELEPLIHRLPTKAGDSIFIPSGRLHAIDAGNLILEIQQNSDTTYRVYDWGRPREIHIEQSLASTDFNDFEPQLTPTSDQNPFTFVKDELFTLTRFFVKSGEFLELPAAPTARILSLVEGSAEGLKPGDNRLIPYGVPVKLTAAQDCTFVVTSNFI